MLQTGSAVSPCRVSPALKHHRQCFPGKLQRSYLYLKLMKYNLLNMESATIHVRDQNFCLYFRTTSSNCQNSFNFLDPLWICATRTKIPRFCFDIKMLLTWLLQYKNIKVIFSNSSSVYTVLGNSKRHWPTISRGGREYTHSIPTGKLEARKFFYILF
jgi:hypothetical protein